MKNQTTKKQRQKSPGMGRRAVAFLLALGLAVSGLAGCAGGTDNSTANAEAGNSDAAQDDEPMNGKAQDGEALDKERGAEAQTERGNTDAADAEEAARQREFEDQIAKRVEEHYMELERRRKNVEDMLITTRAEIQNDFLETMQNYYMSTEDYRTEEGTVGDIITQSVADTISGQLAGGSSTVSAAIMSAAGSIRAGSSPGELVTDAFTAAMDELPVEITAKVYEYMLGGTVMKALTVLDTLATNQQSEHLVNLIDDDLKSEIYELSNICAKQEYTLEDCYRAEDLCDSILQKTLEIEMVLHVNAGSAAWRPYYQNQELGGFLKLDFQQIAFSVIELEGIQVTWGQLDGLGEIPEVTPEELDSYNHALVKFQAEEMSCWKACEDLSDEVCSIYDLDDAAQRSGDTRWWNAAGALIGNPITDILVLKVNEKEQVFMDALAQYNSMAQSLWRQEYYPLKCELVRFGESLDTTGSSVVLMFGAENTVDASIALAILQSMYGEEPSAEAFAEIHREKLMELGPGLTRLEQATRLLRSTYYFALSDSKRNKSFLDDYSYAESMLMEARSLCLKAGPTGDADWTYRVNCTYDSEVCRELARQGAELVKLYEEHLDKRDDCYLAGPVSVPTEDVSRVQASVLVKSPCNGASEKEVVCLHVYPEGRQPLDFYYDKYWNCSWAFDANRQFETYPGIADSISNWYASEKGNPQEAPEKVLRTIALDQLAFTYRYRSELSGSGLSFSEPMNGSLGEYLEDNELTSTRQWLVELNELEREVRIMRQQIQETYQRIEDGLKEGKNTWWLDEEKVTERYLERVVKTVCYEELKERGTGEIEKEAEGFGKLTVDTPLNEGDSYTVENYDGTKSVIQGKRVIYKTEAGGMLTIRLSHVNNEDTGEPYSFWWPTYSYENWVCSQDIVKFAELMER